MKQCPNCKTTYTDESLSFCLDDGARLASLSNNEETLVIPVNKNSSPARFADSSPTVLSPAKSHPPIQEKRSSSFIVAAIIGFLLIAIVGLAAAVGYFLLRPGENKTIVTDASPTPISIVSPTSTLPIDETANLKEKLANLQKQVEAQKNQKQITVERSYPIQPQTGEIRRVNSPNDGFLALRGTPNSETGERLAKIPHGASVTVLGCPKASNIGKMPGRWCQVIYNGQTGWAFDGFLIR